jgi:predicted ATPase
VFPVLQNARVVANAPDHEVEAADELEVRRRAFKALKELLTAVAQRVTLVVHIDDLHWGDADSVQVLEAVLMPPAPRRLLLVCGYRDGTSDALAAMAPGTRERLFGACDFRDIQLGELSSGEAEELAGALLGSGDATTVQAIAAESHGSPLFVAELARWASEQGEVSRAVALEQVILARLAELPDDARALLETLSVARGPLRHGIAERAVGLREATVPRRSCCERALRLHARLGGKRASSRHPTTASA